MQRKRPTEAGDELPAVGAATLLVGDFLWGAFFLGLGIVCGVIFGNRRFRAKLLQAVGVLL